MKKNPIVALSLAVAFVAGGMFSVPVHEMMRHPESAKAAVSATVPEGYTPIYTIDDLYDVRNDLSGNYILMNDIDLSETAPGGDWDCGYGWLPIDNFSGVLDGNGYAIKNMYIFGNIDSRSSSYGDRYIGLFGNGGGNVTNVALVNCNIDVLTSSGSILVGGIVGGTSGYNYPSVTKSYTTGSIKVQIDYGALAGGYSFVGGIAGDAKVNDSFNNCNIEVCVKDDGATSSNSNYNNTCYIGGVTGYNGHILRGGSNYSKNARLYNTGEITVLGENGHSIYQVGNIVAGGSLSNSYYMKTLSDYTATGANQDSSYTNVVGLTKGQMKSSAAYTGFDFDEVWTIDPSADYPYPTLRNVPFVSSGETQPDNDPQTETPSDPSTNPPSDSPQKGDINEDGFVNASDASIILIYAANIGAGNYVSIDDLY